MIISGISKVPSTRSINEDILLRNRALFRKYRDDSFKSAVAIIYDVLNRFDNKPIERGDFGKLSDEVLKMVDRLEDARFFGRMSVGGNNIAPPESVEHRERAWVDQIETTYSFARSIRRFLRHDLQLIEYSDGYKEMNGDMSRYIDVIHQRDIEFVLNNLNKMIERIEIFTRIFDSDIGNFTTN